MVGNLERETLRGKSAEELEDLAEYKFKRHAEARESQKRQGGPPGRQTMEDDLMKGYLADIRLIDKELLSRGIDTWDE